MVVGDSKGFPVATLLGSGSRVQGLLDEVIQAADFAVVGREGFLAKLRGISHEVHLGVIPKDKRVTSAIPAVQMPSLRKVPIASAKDGG